MAKRKRVQIKKENEKQLDKKAFNDLKTQFFWEQKRKEVCEILVHLTFILIVTIIINNVLPIATSFRKVLLSFMLSLFLWLIFYGTFYCIIKPWIEKNWKLAEVRARMALEKTK